MRKKKGNLKVFPLLIVILFIMVGIGFIFNDKTNNSARKEQVIENEEKAVNKKEEKDTESATISLSAFDNISIVHQGSVSEETERATKTRCENQLKDLNLTVTYAKDKDDSSKVVKATVECKPKKGTVKEISNESTLKVEISGGNFNSTTITCKDNGSAEKVDLIPKDTSKESNIELKINFYIPANKEDGKAYCNNVTWKTKYGSIETGRSDNGYSLTEPRVRRASGSRIITPISETSTDDPYERVDGYKIDGLYPQRSVQINTTLAIESATENVPQDVRRDSTSTNYNVNTGTNLEGISHNYDEYNKAFEAMAKCSGNDCFKTEGLKSFEGGHAYSYKFKDLEVDSASQMIPKGVPDKISLFCNEKLTKTQIDYIESYNRQTAKNYSNSENTAKLTEYYYDEANTTYFKGQQVYTYQVGKYIYNYSSTQVEEEAGYCLRTCNEVVKVDYGPPVYSRGGMCFEYRIKVSSIVNCEADTSHIKPPKCDQDICLPVPMCYGYGSDGVLQYVIHQGGPNEDFEACINDCDGGKYTDKCSEKCYNEVYANSSNKVENQIKLTYETKPEAVQLANAYSSIPSGKMHHYYRTSGYVQFKSEGHSASLVGRAWDTFGQSLGLWYVPSRANYYVTNGGSYAYMVNGNGIVRLPTCGDDCHWEGCQKNDSYLDFDCNVHTDAGIKMKYFNAETGAFDEVDVCTADDLQKYDCDYNEKRYKAAVDACKAATTCTNSEATYTIEFKYQEDGTKGSSTKVVKVDTNTNNKVKTNTSNLKPGTILSYGGCYGNKDGKRWYQTEWTMPGTWQENKHQYASYTQPTNKTGWTYLEGQVCLSPYVVEANKAWANEYLKTYVSTGYEANFNGKFKKHDYDDGSTIDGYNIKGESKGFGYFAWKFDVSCFYAISNDETKCNTQPCCVGDDCTDKTCETPPCDKNTTNYTTRSYDDKKPIVNATQNRVILEDGTPVDSLENLPFNWSSDATLKYFNAGGYNNNPERLLKEIMDKANSGQTFSEEQIDYEYIMDAQVIQFIREYNRDHKNYEFEAKTEVPQVADTGIQYYESEFLDQLEEKTLKDGTSVDTPRSQDRGTMRAKNYRAQGSLE